jgi:hypothetical protein
MTFPKTCFNPTCKCKELKIIREVTLRCSNCRCAVKVEVKELKELDDLLWKSKTSLIEVVTKKLLFAVVKNGKEKP